MKRLWALAGAISLAATLTPMSSSGAATSFQPYDFLTSPSSGQGGNLKSAIIRGGASASVISSLKGSLSGPVVNYEQAAALNDTEASYARSHGWLAQTCGGGEIHPGNIPSVTLLDIRDADATAWRVGMVANETNSGGYEATYLDTLGAFYPDSFYSDRPCDLTDTQWRDASIAEVNLMQAATGKPVIENGFGLGSGNKYFASLSDSQMLLEAGDGVQIEHFARSSKGAAQDQKFLRAILDADKSAYAKCYGTAKACTNAFTQTVKAGEDAYLRL